MLRAASGAACCTSCGGRQAPAKSAGPAPVKRRAPIPFPPPAHAIGKGERGLLLVVLACLIVAMGLGVAAVCLAM